MANFFNQILYRPIFNALIVIYHYASFGDMGIAIILLTVLMRLILWPLFHETARYQKLAPKLQSEIKQIQQRHKDNKEEQTKALMKLYKDHEINPFTPFLSLIIQIPLLLALYGALNDLFKYTTSINLLYSFVPHTPTLNTISLGIIDLSKPNIVIIIIAVVLQYYMAKLALPEHEKGVAPSQAERMSSGMVWIGPIVTLIILIGLPSALGVYWAAFAAFSIFQQLIVNYRLRDNGRTSKSDKGVGRPDGLQ
ncbi:MAG: YidC/Oxa1 family membrane protein insertase [Patescibacteria group bacterium]|nr:YidC/Oxa1 family membrane protein insertase [Patescibacteria group bacterium]MCL5224123.1 YidC/Oxa1 family membrane protein insertase [Patescibacteria group bacterium]